MSNITKNLLKNGLEGLARLDEDYFKENVVHALAFKLDEAISDLYRECSSSILHTRKQTDDTLELKEFLNFIETFKPGKYEFKNNSHLNITESDIEAIKGLFESLNNKNRQEMIKEIFEDCGNFKNHVEFYNKIKGLMQ